MIKLYGIDLSFPVNRVRLCLNALGKEYEFIRTSPLAGDTQSDDYKKLSPSGKIPAIDVDGFTLFESTAIMKYLCRKFESGLYPADIEAQAIVDSWCDFTSVHVANGIGKALFNKILAPIVGVPVDEQSMKDGYAFIDRFFGVANDQLAHSDFLAGNSISIADLSLLATVDPYDVLEVDMSKFPDLQSWQERLSQEAFYQKMHKSYATTLQAMQRARQE